ncbi:golgin subfamily A member 1 isoform X2 [Xenopus tropicalis]|uniref:Golgin subfamily A member 1 n=1 Tax=Xenopus tropicalis TaxID=8364 RepID=F6UYS4_XENTR|nr:golgin subfamily A member 1 isoform X2 [Xenopus tropicalis]|eukprot:XP_017952134.1 PREDICTED: golgin subfamily A member 1 isoform X2 [Xenopus tropicalis]
MFTKLKKKIAEEAAVAPRPGGAARIPRTISRESITSAGADSGDDFASDGSSSREDLSSQISRKNEQIRRLEAKLMASMRKFQEQNEAYQANRAKMAEGFALALEKKDQEWMEKLADLEEEKKKLSDQLVSMTKQNMSFFKKREDLDELEGFQQQELAKIKHMLLQKEEMLWKIEEDLKRQREEAEASLVELQDSSCLSAKLSADIQKLQEENTELAQKRSELVAAQEGATIKITELEDRQTELQDFIQRLSLDLQEAQSSASSCKKKLNSVQADYEDLSLQHSQLKAKMSTEAESKEVLIMRLQEKVSSLEKTLDGTYSGEEGLQALLKEKNDLEVRLNESKQELLEGKAMHKDTICQLENQAAKLTSRIQEMENVLHQKDEELTLFKQKSASELKEIEQKLETTHEKLQKQEEELNERESQIKSLQSDLESECSRLTQQLNSVKHQCAEKVERLEAQVSALEGAREFDKAAAQHQVKQLEQDNTLLKERNEELERALRHQEAEQEKMREELSSRETVSVEIAKALEETRKQKEELQQQVASLSNIITENEKELAQRTEALQGKEEEAASLKRDYDAILLQVSQHQSQLETYKTQMEQSEESTEKQVRTMRMQLQEHKQALLTSESQVSSLQEEVSALHEHLHGSNAQELNGDVTAGDIAQLQKENLEMGQQIAEKNKTIKQLQQRMAELKKTLQKELKIKPEPEVNEVQEKQNPEPALPSLTVTNNADLNDSREINFEYLKHVVLKFMSARETEAFHLIKAVSVLLNFSVEEENLLKETLEYKMSWFGSKPAPKGAIRPSISKPRTPWS